MKLIDNITTCFGLACLKEYDTIIADSPALPPPHPCMNPEMHHTSPCPIQNDCYSFVQKINSRTKKDLMSLGILFEGFTIVI